MASHSGLQDWDYQRPDLGRRVELEHGCSSVVTDPDDYPGEHCSIFGVGQHHHNHWVLEADAVGNDHGHRFGSEGPVQVAEEIRRHVQCRP